MKSWRYRLGGVLVLTLLAGIPAPVTTAQRQDRPAQQPRQDRPQQDQQRQVAGQTGSRSASPADRLASASAPAFGAERTEHDAAVAAAVAGAGRTQAPPARALKLQAPGGAYTVPAMPGRMRPGQTDSTEVTLTNTTGRAWSATEWVLSYRWTDREGRDVTDDTNRRATALPRDLAPGEQSTVQAGVTAPRIRYGNAREEFTVHWDLYSRATRRWLSDSGVPALPLDVTVEIPASGFLGLEKFYQYTGLPAGAGSSLMVNQFNGNAVFGYNAFSHPGRGLRTFLRMSYNSMDTEDSGAGPGWALSASTIQRLGTPLDFGAVSPGWCGHPATVTLTDGDGTSHPFRLNRNGSRDSRRWTYDAPAGVHWHLRKNPVGANGRDGDRAWVMTRPDRARAFFDCQGYQTYLADRNDNELTFTYHRDAHGRNTGLLKELTDAAGRRTLTFDYYQRGDAFDYLAGDRRLHGTGLSRGSITGKIRSITDVAGRRIEFVYDDHGLLRQITDGAGTNVARTFGFSYDGPAGDPKLTRVDDPLGNSTRLRYEVCPGGCRRVKELVDRAGAVSGFGYADADGRKGSKVRSAVTDANGHVTTHLLDGFGRTEKLTDAKGRQTLLTWDDDNNVRRLQQANGAVRTWKYDDKTGYSLEIRDAEAVKNDTPPIRLTYRTELDGHVAFLRTKTSAEGRTWTFEHDAKGNIVAVTDPKGTATPTEGDHTTRHVYDRFGHPVKTTDANGHASTFGDFDAVGYPRTVTDALGNRSTSVYDVLGNVVSATDANGKTATYVHDLFGRPLSSRTPKDQERGTYIFVPGPEFDRNDNIIRETAANGAVTATTYDAMDRPVAMSLPVDRPGDPKRLATSRYDKVGNVIARTEPKGNLTGDPGDFTTVSTYDELNRPVKVVDARGNVATAEYDSVGNLVKVVDPRKGNSPAPHDFTARLAYDLNGRPVKETDALGNSTRTEYDLDGNMVAAVDEEGNRTLVELDERGKVVAQKVPYRKDGDRIVHRVTRYEYDQAGNQTKVITPRGVETEDDPDDFVHETVYDELNRVKEQISPFDKDHDTFDRPGRTLYSYDAVGNLTKVSAPPSSDESVRNDTTFTYYDNGWIRSSTDPVNISNHFDYDPLGRQTVNTLVSAGGSVSRTMAMAFYPSGNLAARSDDGLPVGKHEVLVDDSDVHSTAQNPPGGWRSGGGDDGFGPSVHSRPAGDGTGRFTWRLEIPQDGDYTVFVRHPKVTGAAPDAKITITHASGDEVRTVDQTAGPGAWKELGKYRFTEDGDHKITLSDAATPGTTVTADAVKLVRDNSADVDAENKDFGYEYDPNGNLATVRDRSSGARVDTYTMAYDELDQITRLEERAAGEVENTTSFTYDENGNPATRTHDDTWSRFEYDQRDLLVRLTNAASPEAEPKNVTTFAYTPRREVERRVKPNGNTVDLSYHLDGSIRRQAERKDDGTVVAEHTLDYGPNGDPAEDVAKLMDADDPSRTIKNTYTYTYDPLDRISKVEKAGDDPGEQRYVHDANGNVIRQTVEGRTTTHDYDRNRLVSSTANGVSSTHHYDPLGRLNTIRTGGRRATDYDYDGYDRIAELTIGSGAAAKTTEFTHDPFDRTVRESTGDKTKTLNYLGTSNDVVSEFENSKIIKSYELSPNGQKVTQIKHDDGDGEDGEDGEEEVSHFLYHPKGDVEGLTDQDGNTRATYGYTAYGQNDASRFTGADAPGQGQPGQEAFNNYRFNGQRYDQTSGTYDMGFRNYDPGLNRFLTRDMYGGALADM